MHPITGVAIHWHAAPVEEVLAELDTRSAGLSDGEAARRLARSGPNLLRPPRPIPALRILFDQFASIVVLLLIAASAISLSLGDRIEAAAIGVALAINTALGFTIELRARRAMEALLKFDAAAASVLRAGELRRVPASSLVTGDVVELGAGQTVPADARLIAASDLRTIEAALTGESLPISKQHDLKLRAATPLADRTNMVYKGTTITAGTARAVVTAAGQATEIGRIGTLVGTIGEERTPLERRLDILGRRLVWLALAVAALIAALGAMQGASLALVVKLGIALSVAAVPEALPAVATIALAVGLHRMARRHALVRRLPAVEALGSTTIVCADKTRTLTSGEMTAVRLWTAGHQFDLRGEPAATVARADVRLALETAARASQPQAVRTMETGNWIGDPVDTAVLAAASRAGIEHAALLADRPAIAVVPFGSERQLMASFHRVDGRLVACVKGAPRRVLALCQRSLTADGEWDLDSRGREDLLAVNRRFAEDALRVLAVATGSVEAPSEAALSRLTFLGFVGLTDPPARGVKETIERLGRAGLRTIMLTGDQRLTAQAIGRELGLLTETGRVIDGGDMDGLSNEDLASHLENAAAFSRITPEHKLRIVAALQRRGEIVAMLGDGVNDAPALKKADVGVAMGIRGSDVAKEAAAVVLQDDRFETIAAAVEEGRIIFDNIRKFVFYLFSCNVAEVLVLLAAGLFALPIPLLPLQILWLNMVTDTLPALALAMEPGDSDVMTRPPRDPQEAILSRAFLGTIMGYGALITASTLAAFVWGLGSSHGKAVTLSFMTLALAQIFHLGNARSSDPVLHPRRAGANLFAVGAVLISIALQAASVTIEPLARTLRVEALDVHEWMLVVGLAAIPAVFGQASKLRRRVNGLLHPASGTASTGTSEPHTTR